jgi:hypothetical protein
VVIEEATNNLQRQNSACVARVSISRVIRDLANSHMV